MKKRILIIDDNVDLQDIFRIHFESAGYLVYTSGDGFEGLTELLDCKPDIILLDIMMPNMNGYEVLDTLSNHSSIRIPVLICSNLSQESDIKKAYELGAAGYIKKSDISWEDLVKEVTKFVDKKPTIMEA